VFSAPRKPSFFPLFFVRKQCCADAVVYPSLLGFAKIRVLFFSFPFFLFPEVTRIFFSPFYSGRARHRVRSFNPPTFSPLPTCRITYASSLTIEKLQALMSIPIFFTILYEQDKHRSSIPPSFPPMFEQLSVEDLPLPFSVTKVGSSFSPLLLSSIS